MNDDIHPTADEYLETIGYLLEEGIRVIGARLAERMDKSRPTVSEMLERLASGGFLERPGKDVRLTAAGTVRSLAAIRRHRLAERLLIDVVGLPWSDAHAEARRLASVLSPEVEARLVEILGDPATCPHGNPIPGTGRPLPPANAFPLAEIAVGSDVVLVRLSPSLEADRESLRYLEEAGCLPGSAAHVRERGPDGTLVLSLPTGELAVGAALSGRLFVAPGEAASAS